MDIRSILYRYPLGSYFALAYGISWGGILIYLASMGFQFDHIQMEEGLILFFLMLLGPSISGLTLTALLDGRRGLSELAARLRNWRVGGHWYIVALLTVPSLVLIILTVMSRIVSPLFAPSFNFIGLVIGFLAGGVEELGWTGFATPRLLEKHRPIQASFILGLLWSLWHALADFSGNIHSMGLSEWFLWFIVYWILPLTAYRILMTWVYFNTRSLLVGQLMHASYTGWLFTLTPAASGLGVVWQAIFAASLWAFAAVIVLMRGWRLDHAR